MSRRLISKKSIGGQSLVEFGLLLPVLLILVLIAVDFGRIYFTTIQLSNAAREAADYGSEYPEDTTGMLAKANTERNVQTQSGQQNLLAYPSNMSYSCTNSSGGSISCTDAEGGSGAGNRLKVTLTEPFSFITPIISNFFGGTLNISSSATVTVIGLAPDPIDTNPDGCSAPSTPVLTLTATNLDVVIDPAGSMPDTGICAISGYNYDFGDGETGVGGEVPTTHTYAAAGTYTIQLTVTNQGGEASTSRTITVPPATPTPAPTTTATATATATGSATPTPTGTASATPTATPTHTPSPTPAPTATPTGAPTPTPTAAPTPTPTPTATPCAKPVAAFTYVTSSHGSTGHADFTDASTYGTGCPITVWSWNFGDGGPLSNAQNPSHDFDGKNDTYTVTLTVTNSAGSSTVSHSVKPK